MIDLRLLRDNPDLVRTSQLARGAQAAVVDELQDLDVTRRAAIAAADSKRAEQKAFGRTIGKASKEERPALLEQGKALAAEVDALEEAEKAADAALLAAHKAIPNVIQEGAPAGGEQDFVVLRTVGEPAEPDFPVRDHAELGELLGALDTVRGAKVSGARFYFLQGRRRPTAAGDAEPGDHPGAGQRLRPDDPAGPRQARDHGRHRLSR